MNDTVASSAVAAWRMQKAEYPTHAPFHPAQAWPEYRGEPGTHPNQVYDAVRGALRLLKLDESNFGTPEWNPFGTLVRPGDKVLVKPNLIWHAHRYDHAQWQQVITHGSIVRAVVDYVLIALKGKGEVWIADGPQLDANWEEIMARTGLREVCAWYEKTSAVPVKMLDLRDAWEDVRGDVLYGRTSLPGDPLGAVEVNLAETSRFHDHGGSGKYYGASYEQDETNYHHSNGRHEYRLSRTAAAADVLINLPKMKTHKKTGVTLSLKNLVGINSGRNWLPHHTDGDPANGGDQFPEANVKNRSERWGIRRLQQLALRYPRIVAPLFRAAKSCARPVFGHTRETVRSGNWHGNDTAWRMVHDINRALLYSADNRFPAPTLKRYFSLVDGIIAGDGDGPAAPDAQSAGILVAGFNPVAVDCTAARLMGFDPMRLRVLSEAFAVSKLPLANFRYQDVVIQSNDKRWCGGVAELQSADTFHFKPHFGWTHAIEWLEDAALAR